MKMQLFTGLLLSVISTSVAGQTTITFDDQGYAHDADLGKTVTIGNFEFSVRDQNLQEHEFGSNIYYESDLDGHGFGGSGLIYAGDQLNTDDPFYFIIKTVDGTEQDFQSFYMYDYVGISGFGMSLTAEAYRNGLLQGTQDLILNNQKDTYSLNSQFDNVDEIRIRQRTPLPHPDNSGVAVTFDHFVIGSAGVNVPPVVSGLPASIEIIEDTRGELDISSSSFSDEDSDEITAILSVSDGTIALAATGGRPVVLAGNNTPTITVSGTPEAINGYLDIPSNVTYIPPAGLNGSPAAILTVSARDNDGSGDVELGTVPINITGANDAPVIATSGGSTTFTEPRTGSPEPVAIDNALTVADPDNTTLESATVMISDNFQDGLEDVLAFANDGVTMGNITGSYDIAMGILNLSSAGATATLAEWQAALRAVTYSNSSSNPATVNRTITFVAYDGTANSAGATKAVSVQAVNTIPLVANLDGDNVTFTEGGPAVLLDAGADATVSDPDTPNPDDGYVVIHIINGVVGEDMLSIRHEGMGAGQIGVVGGDLHYDGTHIGMITGAGTSSMSVEFLPTATFAAAQALIRNLVYLNSSTNPSLDPRKIRISLNDGVDRVSSLNDVMVNVKALSNAPVVTTSAGVTTFTESFYGGSTQEVIDNALTVTNPGNTNIASATVSITANFQSGEDVLRFTGDGATMGNITGSYNAGTGILSLASAGSAATLAEWQAALRAVTYDNGSHTPNTASRTASFVVSNGSEDSNPATKTIDVVAVNSKPVAVDDALTTSEGVPATGNIRTNDSDPDGDELVAALITAPPISLGSVLLLADGSFTFTPTSANHGGVAKMQYQVYDYAFLADTAWVYVTVEGINDAPEVTAPATIDVDEDVAGPLPGISFADADAGSSSVTATFSAASGTFSATSGGGVTVGGSGTGSLTLAGPIADLNTFIAANNLTFTTALNATGNVTFTVNIDDGGNTGADPGNSGTSSSEADMTAVTVFVKAINDAPLNAVPAPQSIDGDESLIFSTGNSNLVSVSDADAGGSSIQVKLTATNGLVTLPGATGLIFISGDGADDGTMAFYGTIADINQALHGMIFQPTAGFSGAASLQITTSDLGSSGSGESQTDTDLINITVNPINPVITTVNASRPDGAYKLNEVIPVTITFNQAVDVTGGTPNLLLETGATDRKAVYSSGSGSNTLLFNYTVQAGDLNADLDYASTAALALNAATIQSGSGMDAVLTLPVPGGGGSIAGQHDIVIDGVKPVVSSAGVPADAYYQEGDVLGFILNFDENVNVNDGGGTPYLALTIGSATVQADYTSGSGSSVLNFQYIVQAGEQDLDGIELGSSIVMNGGTIRDAAGNDAAAALNNAASTDNVFVYSLIPGVTLSTTASSPVNQAFTLSIVFTEAVTGFDLTDVSFGNATLSSLQTADNITYTALVTPSANGTVSLSVPAGAAQNIANNDNTASNTLNLIYDNAMPAIPQGLAAVPRNGQHVIIWTANSESDLAAYALYGATTPNPTALLTRINAPATTYTHTGVAAGVTWYYRLAAIDQAGNESGRSEEASAIVKFDQEITFASSASVIYGMADFDPGAISTNSSMEIMYRSSDEEIASIAGGMVHINKAGTVTITASQEGNALYNEAIPRDQVLTIEKAPLTVTAENKTRKFGEENPLFTFSYEGFVNGEDESQLGTPPLASTEATPLSPPGEYPIIASGAAADNYMPRYVNGTLTVVPAARTLTFAQLPEKTYGDADFDLTGEANTGETVIYSSSNTAVAEIVNGKVRITGAGTATITATLPENANYSNTPEISRELLVKKAPQEIHFAEIGQVQRDAGTLQLDVSASSGLAVQLEVRDNLVATLTGPSDLLVLRLGRTIITATQPGNANYLPAAPVERELLVVDQAGQRVRVHQVVSPNSDGINDFLIIEGIRDFPDNRMVIVNRNGISMFETKGYDNGSNIFHGKANTRVISENLPAGTYFYLLEYRNGSEMQRLKGWFVLKYQ
ncbi:gliding motility-associated-like protein [Anseongella ginsenosidimutans]|uniref:Gliding motility-associated-like protein n=1 Tax=Anseongella ginsenosidimutans TaxID=496056 RepID=A0A4R3KPB3_9SPHI|nr:MBG domain-containing protein [Anseongella ginsenosidimutans]TCS85076.1 gliding motility-associated-like protein [Anseongella ginsenosidimutans]